MSIYSCTNCIHIKNSNICDYLNDTLKAFSYVSLSDNYLNNLTVWLGTSKWDETSINTKKLYQCIFEKLGITVLDCDFSAIIDGREECDAILMFTITPGTSARAIELIAKSEYHENSNKLIDKLHVYMPEEYKKGYISRKISETLIAGKIFHKEEVYFSQLDKDIFLKCITNLITISKDKRREMELKFNPTILIMTALPKEFQAVKDLFDEKPRYDSTFASEKIQFPHYKINQKDIVLAKSGMGNNTSSAIATKILEKYPSIKYIIMVGIAGGIPNVKDAKKHIRLGDIVISGEKGIIQYDMGKETKDGKEYNFSPRPICSNLLRNAEVIIEDSGKGKFDYWDYYDKILAKDEDKYKRQEQSDLKDTPWDENSEVKLPAIPKGFDENRPRIHIGSIASGNSVIKESNFRKKLINDFPDIKAVEMEASGVSDASWLVGKDSFIIRGICDYCNPDKHKEWQEYAAAVAAAFAYQLIETL